MADDLRRLPAKRVLIRCLVGVLLVLGLPPLVKLVWYEAAGAASVRASVGQPVTLRRPDNLPAGFAQGTGTFQGTLVDARYRFNDKWGFFDLYVVIEGNGSIATGLRPSDLMGLSTAPAAAR